MSTKIEWCEETWNPITGCTKVSEGCKNCYAERMATRLAGRCGYPKDNPFRPGVEHPDQWDKPLHWRKPRRVFVSSMGDLFHEDVHSTQVDKVLVTAALSPRHTFMLLTKRPDRMMSFFESSTGLGDWLDRLESAVYRLGYSEEAACQVANSINGHLAEGRNVGWPMKNLWLGVTAENQAAADERIPILLQIPVAVRFVSVEPMLGPVDVWPWISNCAFKMHHPSGAGGPWDQCLNYDYGERGCCPTHCKGREPEGPGLDWVICGGETGPGARPMHPDWARGLRDQCVEAGTPFFFKSFGDWAPAKGLKTLIDETGRVRSTNELTATQIPEGWAWVDRVGKKAAGRELDGQTWDQLPEVG